MFRKQAYALLSLVLAACLVGVAPRAMAVNPDTPLSQLERTEWGRAQGAPTDLSSLAQTSEGYLWTQSGRDLFQFDGAVFREFGLAATPNYAGGLVSAMTADREGGLWLGYFQGGASHIKGSVVASYKDGSGLPNAGQVGRILYAQGQTLAATQAGLFVLKSKQWVPAEPAALFGDHAIDDIALDRAGTLWVITQQQVLYRPKNAAAFLSLPLPWTGNPISGLVASPDGTVWAWSLNEPGSLCRIWPRQAAACWVVENIYRPIVDAHGSLWWGNDKSMMRIAWPSRLNVDDPLAVRKAIEMTPAHLKAMLAGRDGTIWGAGPGGLLRLRQRLVHPAPTPTGGLAPASGSGVWLASYNRGVMRIGTNREGRASLFEANDGTLWHSQTFIGAHNRKEQMTFSKASDSVDADQPVVLERLPDIAGGPVRIDRTTDDTMWVGRRAPSSLTQWRKGQMEDIPLPKLDRGAVLRGTLRDGSGHLWLGVSLSSIPLYQLRGEKWIPYGGRTAPKNTKLTDFTIASNGDVWIATGEDSVSVLGRTTLEFHVRDGLDIGAATQVVEQGKQIWVAGARGIAVFHDGRFVTLRGVGGERFAKNSGLLVRSNGDVWLNAAAGVSLIKAGQWQRALSEPGYEVRFSRLDFDNGIDSPAIRSGPYPSIAEAEDGVIWLAMSRRLYWLDPNELPKAGPAPSVLFRGIRADSISYLPEVPLSFAPLTNEVQVDYGAPGASFPERTRFRYRLTPSGKRAGAWIYSGTQRTLRLARMDPGKHLLEVAATGDDGLWSTETAKLNFQIRPAFHQTWAFKLIVALAGAALLFGLYLLRIRQVARQIHDQARARLMERERIARDLHDTLLQGIQGMLFGFQAIAARLPQDDPLRSSVEQTMLRTEKLMKEGRDRVQLLRDPLASTLDLPETLVRHATELAADKQIKFASDTPRPARPLKDEVYEQVLQIGREALTNAFRHSSGTMVHLTLDYEDQHFTLTVEDDGDGLADANHLERHWGIRGMHERAKEVGGQMSIVPNKDKGTTAKLVVPGDRAYPVPPGRGFSFRKLPGFLGLG